MCYNKVMLLCEIRVGDLIDGAEVIEIRKDPFTPNQIDITLDEWIENEFAEKGQKVIRIRSYEGRNSYAGL